YSGSPHDTTINYTISLHDALPIYKQEQRQKHWEQYNHWKNDMDRLGIKNCFKCLGENLSTLTFYDNDYPVKAEFHCDDCYCCIRSEEHTSELQSRFDLVCRLLLEK